KSHIKHGSRAAEFDAFARCWIVDLGYIDTMSDTLSLDDTTARHVRPWAIAPSHPLAHCVRETARGDPSELHAIPELQTAIGSAAKSVRLFQDRIEYRRKIAGRRIDHPQHLGSRRLPLQRLAGFGQQPRVLHGDHGLGREVL